MCGNMFFSKAWDVPNSNLVVNLKKMGVDRWVANPNDRKFYYTAGVSVKSRVGQGTGYSMFNERGDDPYGAFESLMLKIDKAVELIFRIVDACGNKESIEVVKAMGYEQMPLASDDFPVLFFSSLSRMMTMMERNGTDFWISIRRVENENRHVTNYGVISVGDEIVFKGKPAYDKGDVLANVRNAVLGAAAMLDKFQSMAWNVMIDNSDSEYDVVSTRAGLVLKESNAKETMNV